MESQSIYTEPTTIPETVVGTRRTHVRSKSSATCLVKTRNGLQEYSVRNLSVGGALLTGGPSLPRGCPLIAVLHIPFYPEVRVPAKAVHESHDDAGRTTIGIEFIHRSDVTEDHIQAALLSELERSRTNGCIADVLLS